MFVGVGSYSTKRRWCVCTAFKYVSPSQQHVAVGGAGKNQFYHADNNTVHVAQDDRNDQLSHTVG